MEEGGRNESSGYSFDTQVSLGGMEAISERKEALRIAAGLPASYELQCPPLHPVINERTPAPLTPPPTVTESDNSVFNWEREETELPPRPPKLRPKVRYSMYM